jgi:endonuclease YncB( thermonuclease family)
MHSPLIFLQKSLACRMGTALLFSKIKSKSKSELAHIDCPEGKQAFGTQAKKFTSELAFGKDVKIMPTDKDRYGRTVAVVVLTQSLAWRTILNTPKFYEKS